jgi:hypothetical protein
MENSEVLPFHRLHQFFAEWSAAGVAYHGVGTAIRAEGGLSPVHIIGNLLGGEQAGATEAAALAGTGNLLAMMRGMFVQGF